MTTDAMTLRRHLESLPQEIYDDIYNYTFAAPSTDQPVIIHPGYKPPAIFQVNRSTRVSAHLAYSQGYYGGWFIDTMSWLSTLKKDNLNYRPKVLCWTLCRARPDQVATGYITYNFGANLDGHFDVRMFMSREEVSLVLVLVLVSCAYH